MADIHLLVLIHGMWGNPGHLARMHEIILETKGKAKTTEGDLVSLSQATDTELIVLVAQTNRDEWTYDGIDWGGERIAKEVMDEVRTHQARERRVTRFSIVGYSLGGLLARYVIGILHQNKFFDTVMPVNFNTIATPHIGIPRSTSLHSAVVSYVGRNLLARTGEQLFCVDQWTSSGRPLIEVLADPDHVFYQGLLLFQNVVVYANAVLDLTVPYVTAVIALSDPFYEYKRNGIKIEFHEDYNYLIKSYSVPDPLMPLAPKPFSERILSSLPPVPPRFRYEFPYNIAVMPLLIILVPTLLSIVFVNFSVSSYKSRSRVQVLLAESRTAGDRLVHTLTTLEQELETAARGLYASDGNDVRTPLALAMASKPKSMLSSPSSPTSIQRSQPLMTPSQIWCVESLSKIPQLRRERAFFEGKVNTHAMIVCRDPTRFEFHRKGESVLRHLADHFEI